ncbi:MAG TPA: FAD-binding oxidoreductase [Candidatus Acidoferrales bacterium]|nr:FAD-binding oxidoreductase [Candidatus Acidoferrales bacterium]
MSVARASCAARLGEIAGAGHTTEDPAQLAGYAIEGAAPRAAVRPASSAEIAEIIKFAVSERLAIVPCGARTKLGIGLPPRQYDIALDLTRMDRVIAFDPGDLTLSVEAGIPFRQVQAALAEHGQFLPLAPPWMRRTTVGGTIAAGMDGPLRQLYGTARDFVLGMEFVTGDGVAAKSGGRVVKNVTGYDLHKLMIGALGTLGILTRINFRTFPAPTGARAMIACFDAASGALDLPRRIAQSPLRPLTVDVLSPAAHELLSSAVAGQADSRPPGESAFREGCWVLGAGFAGDESACARYERELRAMAAEAGATGAVVLSEEDTRVFFARHREWIPLVLESFADAAILRIGVPPARMGEILEMATNAAGEQGLRCAAIARGAGVIYFALLADAARRDAEKAALAAGLIQAACASLGGHATVPWCKAEWKGSFEVWGGESGAVAQMRKMKGVFDPGGALSPGRFVGGI